MKMKLLSANLYLTALCPLIAQIIQPIDPLAGTEIAWASEAFATNLMADGITTFEASGDDIRFELGTFAPGFDPRTATPEQWLTSWIVLQGAGYDMVDQQFIQTTTLYSNATPFLTGGQAFIWGYNTKDINSGAEWLIVGAPSWTWPASNSPLPTTFSMSDALQADVIFGSVNQSGHHMQLGAVTPVPEPGTMLLAAIATVGCVLRRRR
jgi:hypothetical protein